MSNPSRDWIADDNRLSQEYKSGVSEFIRRARYLRHVDGKIRCPCRKCNNKKFHTLRDVRSHLLTRGFTPNYTIWVQHEETSHPLVTEEEPVAESDVGGLHGAVHDIMDHEDFDDAVDPTPQELREEEQIEDLFAELKAELYPGCKEFSSLSFLVELMHLKVTNQWTNKSFTSLLQLLRKSHPTGNRIPEKHYEAKAKLKRFGMSYEKIDVCPKDCILFRKEHANKEFCPICNESRWVLKSGGKKVARKILRYFPLKDRLTRLYASRHTANLMQWHEKERHKENGVLRHPADALAWKSLDERYPDFADDPRNVRLGLAADGFNPFGDLSLSYSVWPVVMTAYNLPPWLCMKPEYLMLTLLIPGPKSPGKDIDVFLQPLIEELKELWETGVRMRDAANNNEVFQMRAVLLWTINDFPARSSLSGWSGQGYHACSTCNTETPSLSARSKIVYYDHRRYLPDFHRMRKSKHYKVRIEKQKPPKKLTVSNIRDQLSQVTTMMPGKHADFGGKNKRKRDFSTTNNWKKKSIFYELPYWLESPLKHNLDVMHIEKNVCENLVGTLLSINGKNKDNEKARRDLMDLNIKPLLHLKQHGSNWYKPPAEYALTESERIRFTDFLKSVKFPDGLAGNLNKNVTSDGKLAGLKSHDCHVLMQRLLAPGLRPLLPKPIHETIAELCSFFKLISSRTLHVDDLKKAEMSIIEILCKLEVIFPPAFFTIMVHVVMHLPEETLNGGPVHLRWMYPFERYLGTLKHFVKNRAKPEGSIAEAYVIEEALLFCGRYLEEQKSVPEVIERQLSVFQSNVCKPYGAMKPVQLDEKMRHLAEWYILSNCSEVDTYMTEHLRLMQAEGRDDVEKAHREEFRKWFSEKIYNLKMEGSNVSDELYALSMGSYATTQVYPNCEVNGVKFTTFRRDDTLTTQNSGVSVPIDAFTYYGKMEDVIVLEYRYDCRVVLFQCHWFGDMYNSRNIVRKDPIFGTVSAYVAKKWFNEEPFILATQAKQVFYIDDLQNGSNWEIVEDCNHRFLWDLPDIDGPSSSTVPLSVQPTNFDASSFCRIESQSEHLIEDSASEEDDSIDEEDDEEDASEDIIGNLLDEDMDEDE